MLCHDIIQPSSSSSASPVVLVKEMDGTLRFCLDYRLLKTVSNRLGSAYSFTSFALYRYGLNHVLPISVHESDLCGYRPRLALLAHKPIGAFGCLARWSARLQEFGMTVIYTSGRKHSDAIVFRGPPPSWRSSVLTRRRGRYFCRRSERRQHG